MARRLAACLALVLFCSCAPARPQLELTETEAANLHGLAEVTQLSSALFDAYRHNDLDAWRAVSDPDVNEEIAFGAFTAADAVADAYGARDARGRARVDDGDAFGGSANGDAATSYFDAVLRNRDGSEILLQFRLAWRNRGDRWLLTESSCSAEPTH